MLANLFRKTKIISLSLGAFLIFLIFVFYHGSNEFLGQDPLSVLGTSAVMTFLLIMTLIFLLLQERRYRHIKIYTIHSLSAVLILFYLPPGSVTPTGLLIQFFLAMALHFISMIFQTKKTLKPLFNLTIILSGLAVLESFFFWFFLGPLLFFLDERIRNTKHLLVIFVAVLSSIVWAITIEQYFQLDFFFKGSQPLTVIDIKKIVLDELLLIVLMGLIVLIQIKNTTRRDMTSNPVIQTFLFTWLFLGIYSSFFGGTALLKPWELTLFPLLYLFGNFLNEASNKKGTLLVLVLLMIKGLSVAFV